MAENKLSTTVASLFDGMDKFMSSKTVVGDVVHIKDKIIIPLIDVSFGVGAGAWDKTDKGSAAGGLGGKMSPAAVLVISDDGVKMVPVSRSQDVVSKVIDMVPDIINKFTKGSDRDDTEEIVEDVVHKMENDGEQQN
ncbi:MAG TPA: sporulation protein [Candidatus Scybalocola faecipullorum]|nr:sporulation protein [Candidatus Scybalocola faecipullorum]